MILFKNDTDYFQYGQKRLIELYKETLGSSEKGFYELYDLNHIIQAKGNKLNKIGKKLGINRSDLCNEYVSDGDYQTALLIQALVNKGKIKSQEIYHNELSKNR